MRDTNAKDSVETNKSKISNDVLIASYKNEIRELKRERKRLEPLLRLYPALEHIKEWTDKDVSIFIETRLEPFSLSLKYTRRVLGKIAK